MNISDFELARALLMHLRAPEEKKDDTFWAWERVEELIASGRVDQARDVIVTAIGEAETDRDLALIGAGVLESLVTAHADDVIAAVVTAAEASPKVARAVRNMYLFDLRSDQIEQLMRAIQSSQS